MTLSNKSDRRVSTSTEDRQWQWCFLLVLLVALIYGLIDLTAAFQGEYIVQDDARQHVFWMARFLDGDLFPNDLIADYFQSVAPVGYRFLYKTVASLGIDPFVFNKFIPVVLRLAIASYFFLLCRSLFPVAIGCTVTTLFLNHSIWLKDDIVSGTPRAFLYPFLIAFLYYFTKQAIIPSAISIILLGLFYPQIVLIVSGVLILNLITWREYIPTVTKDKKAIYFSVFCLISAFIVLLPYALKTSDYAPIITRSEALNMPEFHPGGRSNFFKDSIFQYLIGRGNGVMISTALFNPIIFIIGLSLPYVVERKDKFVLAQKITRQIALIPKLLLSSLSLYILAHIVLFRLHLPSRYTTHSLRISIVLATGITITIWVDYLWQFWQKKYTPQKSKVLIRLTILAIALITYNNFFDYYSPTGYKIGKYPQLYEFFQQQPKDIVIASIAKEADNLPTFSKRSVLVSREYAIPYQLGFYKPFHEKAKELIAAQYSNNLEEVRHFISKHQVSYWLLDRNSFTIEYLAKNSWFKQFQPEQQNAVTNLKNNSVPILQAYQDSCEALQVEELSVIDTECLLEIDTK